VNSGCNGGLEPLLRDLDSPCFWGAIVVPASGLEAIYERFSRRNRLISATREEEAVAIAAGLAVAGAAPFVLISVAGVGNCLNAVFTLADAYGIYFPIIVYDRGPFDDNPIQRVSSAATGLVLQALHALQMRSCDPASMDAFRRHIAANGRWVVLRLHG
jgi:sulfopyruvate decarboxylase TPP-binding subunit